MSNPTSSNKRGLRQFDRNRSGHEQEVYRDDSGDYWEAIGWITHPATLLRNMRTGERHVEVIGCLNAERFAEVSNDKLWELYALD